MVPKSKNSFSFVAALLLSLILSISVSTAADQILSPPVGGEFGSAVDIQGNIAVIGNPHIRRQGVVYIFEQGPAGWQLVKTLLPPVAGDSFTRFGARVTLSGNRMAVGDSHSGESDLKAGHTGRVYVYEKQGLTWPDQPAYVIEPSQPSVFAFGYSHAFSGEYLAVMEFVSLNMSEPDKTVMRVKTYRLQNGQATLLGTTERNGREDFGAKMSMSGSELAILSVRKRMQGTLYIYDLSDGTMRQTEALAIPMVERDFSFCLK